MSYCNVVHGAHNERFTDGPLGVIKSIAGQAKDAADQCNGTRPTATIFIQIAARANETELQIQSGRAHRAAHLTQFERVTIAFGGQLKRQPEKQFEGRR